MFDSLVTHSHSPPFSLARKYKILGNGFASPNKMRGRISIIFNYCKKEEERPKIVVGGKGCDTNENFTEKKISFFSLNEKNSYSNEKLIPRHIDPNPERGKERNQFIKLISLLLSSSSSSRSVIKIPLPQLELSSRGRRLAHSQDC